MIATVEDAAGTPEGARWIRAALQVNPYEYEGNPSPAAHYTTEDDYNDALLAECNNQGIELIAITDHWRASSAASLMAAAGKLGITALPGFEANTSEGVHVLVIFAEETKLEDITLAIGACGISLGDPHAVSPKSFTDIAAEMTGRGALVIPAHVNVSNSGLLARCVGAPLESIIKSKHIDVLGVTPSVDPLGDQVKILKNQNPYKRKHPLVEIYADDVSAPSALSTAGASSWFKMCEPSLEGLKHAVRTPETRVRTTDPKSTSNVLLKRISWIGGFLDGQSLPLSDDLTALIGGRGTGKSTVIESLRYVLGISPIGEAAKKDHEGVVRNVIRTATTITLSVEVASPSPERYSIERTVPDPPIVNDASGTATNLLPKDVVGNLEIFGQHELAELAQDKVLMARMVERIAGEPVAAVGRPALMQSLADNRDALSRLEQRQADLEIELADIPRLTEQSNKFSESDLGAKLESQTLLKSEEGIFEESERRVRVLEVHIRSAELEALADQLSSSLPNTEDSPRSAQLKPALTALTNAAQAVKAAHQSLLEAARVAGTAITEAKATWQTAVKPDQEAHAEIFRQLLADGYQPDTYLATKTQLDRLTTRADQREVLTGRRKALLAERTELLKQLTANDTAITTELTQAIRIANKATSKTVIVKPIPNPDRSHLKMVVDKHFNTQRTQIMAAMQEDGFSTRAFVAAVRENAAAMSAYKISGAQLTTLLSKGEPFLRELEEQSVGTAVDVHLNVAPKGGSDLRRLEDLSKGQRATALLLLLLGASPSPLVIDQPEDDLDNRFIYDGIVTRLRSLKGARQVVVSTHNANVPVLGDAEVVIVLEGDGTNGWPATDGIGSLDVSSVRAHAEHLLEGGRDAFTARQHLYGF
jgi:ABC-type Mn2+/Zn2+ transport system ATPase subunit